MFPQDVSSSASFVSKRLRRNSVVDLSDRLRVARPFFKNTFVPETPSQWWGERGCFCLCIFVSFSGCVRSLCFSRACVSESCVHVRLLLCSPADRAIASGSNEGGWLRKTAKRMSRRPPTLYMHNVTTPTVQNCSFSPRILAYLLCNSDRKRGGIRDCEKKTA